MEVGERIRNLRIQSGLTQKELATRCGLPANTISRVESGKTQPQGLTLHKLAAGLNVEPGEFKGERQLSEAFIVELIVSVKDLALAVRELCDIKRRKNS